jgi:hypothetical protein
VPHLNDSVTVGGKKERDKPTRLATVTTSVYDSRVSLLTRVREGRQEVHYRMFVGKARGKRPFGTPSWREGRVKLAPREMGYENVNWIKLGEKKDTICEV